MKTKRLLAALLLSAYLSSSAPFAFAGDDMNPVMKLSLDYVTASLEQKDASKGLEEFAKKQFNDEFTWKYVVGNYEKLLFQNKEHDFPEGKLSINDFREKINKVTEAIQRVEQVATQLGEGKYDEAVFTAADQAVSTFDHPVVTAIWAGVKLTYESHKLVRDTGAELQIEALYGALENDRKLCGVTNEEGLKLFSVTADSVDYFFNKYLITNDTTREQVKAYIKVRLGEDFPEASYWQGFKGYVLGENLGKAHELEQLETYKNISRRWIMSLMQDLNKQAETRWHEYKVRKALVEFQKFAKQHEHLDVTLEQLLKEFNQKSEYIKESKKYPEYLANIQKQKNVILDELGKIKGIDIPRRKQLYNKAEAHYYQCLSYGSQADLIGKKDFSSKFYAERDSFSSIMKEIKLPMENVNSAVVIEDEIKEMSGTAAKSRAAEFLESYFSSLLTEYSWKIKFEDVKKEYLDLLNSGDFETTQNVLLK